MHEVTIDLDQLQYKKPLQSCVLSGITESAVFPLSLRRMYFLGPVWVGEGIELPLPMSRERSYAFLQYMRTFRWIIALLAPIAITANLELPLEQQWIKPTLYFSGAIATWLVIGQILRFEKLRLVRILQNRRQFVVRFYDQEALKRFQEQVTSGAA